jgi:hypothetical protein
MRFFPSAESSGNIYRGGFFVKKIVRYLHEQARKRLLDRNPGSGIYNISKKCSHRTENSVREYAIMLERLKRGDGKAVGQDI